MPVDTNKYRHSYYYSYYYYCKYYRPVYTLYVLIVVSAVCCNRSCVYMMTLCTCVWSDRHCVCVMLMCVCGLCVVWQALCLCDADVSCVALRTRVKWTLMVVQDHVVVLMDIKVLTVTGHLLSLSLSPCLPLCLSLCLSVSLSLCLFFHWVFLLNSQILLFSTIYVQNVVSANLSMTLREMSVRYGWRFLTAFLTFINNVSHPNAVLTTSSL